MAGRPHWLLGGGSPCHKKKKKFCSYNAALFAISGAGIAISAWSGSRIAPGHVCFLFLHDNLPHIKVANIARCSIAGVQRKTVPTLGDTIRDMSMQSVFELINGSAAPAYISKSR